MSEFIYKVLNTTVENCGDALGLLMCIFIYLSIFEERRKKWSLRKEIGILTLVTFGIAVGLASVVSFLETLGFCHT